MLSLAFSWLSFGYYITLAAFLFLCVVMILLVLIQRGRGGGLSGAFGGAGGNTAFGSKTGDVLTWATSIVFGVFMLVAVALNLLANVRHQEAMQSATAVQASVGGGTSATPPAAAAGAGAAAGEADVQPPAANPPANGITSGPIAPPIVNSGAPPLVPDTRAPVQYAPTSQPSK